MNLEQPGRKTVSLDAAAAWKVCKTNKKGDRLQGRSNRDQRTKDLEVQTKQQRLGQPGVAGEMEGKGCWGQGKAQEVQKARQPGWSRIQCPSCYQEHGLNFSDLELPASPSLDTFVFLVACQEKQWYVNCCNLNAILWAGCGVFCWWLVCAVTLPECRTFGHAINTFFSFITRNGILGTWFWEQCSTLSAQVILSILVLLLSPHCLHTHFNSDFTSTLLFLLQISYTCLCGIINMLCLIQMFSKSLEDGYCSSRWL